MSEGDPTGSEPGGMTPGVLAAVLAAVREPVLVLDRSSRVIFASTAFCDTHGVGDVDLRGHTLYEIIDGAFDVPELRAHLEPDGEGRESVCGVEVTLDFTRLGRRTLLVNAIRDEDRGIVVLAMEDVTESRRSQSQLQEFSQRFELFAENVREYAIFAMDVSGRITLWNPGAERILGWSEEEALGQSGEIIFTPEDRALGVPQREFESALRDGQALDDRWQVRKDGSRFWASGVTTALRDGGPARGFVKILRDNTRRKQAEMELEESHRWLRRILQVTPDVVALYDLRSDRLGFVSPHLIANLGYGHEDFYTLDREAFSRILHPDDLARGPELRKVLLEYNESVPYELSLRVFDAEGVQRWYHVRVVPFRREADGRVREVLVVARDFTEIHETQEELHRLMETLERRVEERTAQVRTLASTLTMAEQQERRRISQILHDDVQQRLYGIQMKMAAIRRAAESAGVERLEQDALAAEKWLRDTIDVARDLTVALSPPVLKGEGLVDALQWLVVQMERMHGLRVTLHAPHSFFIPDEDMRVLLFQIVRELLFNVVKHAETDEARVSLGEEDDFLVITVIDRGRGFVDEPTAATNHDAGFGLYSVRERLQLFGGGIRVQTAPGAGTRVEVRVPKELVS